MMLVPDPRYASEAVKARLLAAFAQMKTRQIGPLVDVDGVGPEWSGELAQADRQALDDAALELLGVADPAEREQLRSALYDQITLLYREIRRGERTMQRHRTANTRRTRPTAQTLAREIWASLAAPPVWSTPASFVAPGAPSERVTLPQGRARLVQATLFRGAGLQIGETFLETGAVERAQYLKAFADLPGIDAADVPHDAAVCAAALAAWQAQRAEQQALFEAEAAARTVNAALQQSIVAELWRLTRTGGQA
jgi:hypothetical protein